MENIEMKSKDEMQQKADNLNDTKDLNLTFFLSFPLKTFPNNAHGCLFCSAKC